MERAVMRVHTTSLLAVWFAAGLCGGVRAQVGFQPASELVAVEPPPGVTPVNAAQVILGMASRYVVAVAGQGGEPYQRIGVTTDFQTILLLDLPANAIGAEAVAASDDGHRVLGRVAFSTAGMVRACTWDGEGGSVVVNANGQQFQQPVGMSSDGERLVVVSGLSLAHRSVWVENETAIDIDPVGEEPHLDTFARAVSRDGRTVVGMYNDHTGVPFVWSPVEGGYLLDPPLHVQMPKLVSDGGRRVACIATGSSASITLGPAGVWRTTPTFQPSCVSADGSLLLGAAGTSTVPAHAAVWSETIGVESLAAALAARGVNTRGWTLRRVEYISSDARKIVGAGTAPGSTVVRRWVATVEPFAAADIGQAAGVGGSDGKLDNNDFIVFIDRFFAEDVRADVGRAGAERGGDGTWDNNDFCVFIGLFFGGQP